MELISVIIPVYKTESYLERCIDSVLAQTWTNLQIIAVDDGSPDRSGAILDEYAKRDPRVTVIHQKNKGVSAARNAGLAAASGDYIGFVDSDDALEPDMYEVLIPRNTTRPLRTADTGGSLRMEAPKRFRERALLWCRAMRKPWSVFCWENILLAAYAINFLTGDSWMDFLLEQILKSMRTFCWPISCSKGPPKAYI